MLTESFIAATETVKPLVAHLSSNLKDVGVFLHEIQPQNALRQGYKKSSATRNCIAYSRTHIFAAQAGKAVVNVYNRTKVNQEATIPFPQKISSLAYANSAAILILGAQDGKLILWEIATGRISTSSASHIEAVTNVITAPDGDSIISASSDSIIHVWSLRNLVQIGENQGSLDDTTVKNDPLSTFSHHRSAIEALAVGHSHQANTNFVASASEDKICYIWNLSDLHVLRTVLLVQSPRCAIIDPADRAIFMGSEDGSVQMIDLLGLQSKSKSSILANSGQVAAAAIQLKSANCWSAMTGSDTGAAQCIALGYDGTSLVTGHYSGKVLHWDVAKHRLRAEITNLSGQSVTNIQMLNPSGFLKDGPVYVMSTIVRPRLDLTAVNNSSSSTAVSAEYTFSAQVLQEHNRTSMSNEIEIALTSSFIPQSMLDAAIQSLARSKVTNGNAKLGSQVKQGDAISHPEIHLENLHHELASLRAQVASHQKLDQERLDKHIARMQKREALGFEKRQAYFAAKQNGKMGDVAMEPYSQLENELDAESDEEVVAETATQSNGSKNMDVEMKG